MRINNKSVMLEQVAIKVMRSSHFKVMAMTMTILEIKSGNKLQF